MRAENEVALGFGYDTYAPVIVSGFCGMPVLGSWMAPLIVLTDRHSSIPRDAFMSSVNMILGGVAAFAVVIAPWLVPLLVLRARQPQGARVEWDDTAIREWDGTWRKTVIPWSRASVARIVWTVATKSGPRRRVALQIFDSDTGSEVITVCEELPKGAPIVRHRLVASNLTALERQLKKSCSMVAPFAFSRMADPDRRAQPTPIRVICRLGYVFGLFGMLLQGPEPKVGIFLAVCGTLLLAWRAVPVLREVRLLSARRRAAPEDAGQALALSHRFRATCIEAVARVLCAVGPVASTVALGFLIPPT